MEPDRPRGAVARRPSVLEAPAMRRLALLLPLAACGGPSDTDTSATSEASSSAATSSAGTTGATTPGPTTGAPTSGGTSEAGSTSAATSTGLTATDGTGDATATTATTTTATTDATTDASSTGGSSGDASTGSTGEPPACQPGDMQACYDGPPDTQGKGLCKAGVALCDQGVFGPCAGAVLPAPESCDTPGDEDCDGLDPCAGDGPYQWHKVWGAGGDERGVRVGFDAAGALVLAAQGSSVSDFGGGPLVSAGSWDLYLAKFAPDGAHLWSKRFGDAEAQFGEGWALAVTAAGDIVVGGDFDGKLDLGGGALVSGSIADAFLARFTGDGAHVWSKAFKAGTYALPQAVAVDKDGGVFFTGYFTGSLDLGGGTMQAPGVGKDVFLGKFTAAGAHVWSTRFGDTADQYAYGLAADATGNAYVAGSFAGAMNPGNGVLTSAGSLDVFVAKFSPVGNAVWAKRFGDSQVQEARGLTIDAQGRVTVAGNFVGSLDLGNGPLVAPSNRGFVAQFDGGGATKWSKLLATGDVVPASIAADGLGSLIATGYFTGASDFGGGVLTSEGDHDIFAVKLTPAGAHVWSKRFGDFKAQDGIGAAGASTGAVAITGGFIGGLNLGGGPATSKGGYDGFLAVYGP